MSGFAAVLQRLIDKCVVVSLSGDVAVLSGAGVMEW